MIGSTPYRKLIQPSKLLKISKAGLPDSFLFGSVHLALTKSSAELRPQDSEGFKNAQQYFIENSIQFAAEKGYTHHRHDKDLQVILGSELFLKLEHLIQGIDWAKMPFATKLYFRSLLNPKIPLKHKLPNLLLELMIYIRFIDSFPELKQEIYELCANIQLNGNCTLQDTDDPAFMPTVKEIEKTAKRNGKPVHLLDSQETIVQEFLAASTIDPSQYIIPDKVLIKAVAYFFDSVNLAHMKQLAQQLFQLMPEHNRKWYIDDCLCYDQNKHFMDPKLSLQELTNKHGKPLIDYIQGRSKKWMSSLVPALNTASCYIDVGYGHLYGSGNLVALLEAEGFTLTPIECPVAQPALSKSASQLHSYNLRKRTADSSTQVVVNENSTQVGKKKRKR